MKVMSWSASIPFACCRQETQKTVRRPRDCRFNLVFRSSSRSCCKVTGTAAAKGSFPQSGMVDGAFKSLRGIYASSGNSKGKTVSASAKSDQGFDQEDEDGPSEPASGWPAEECAPGMVSACMVAAAVFGVAAAADIGVLPGCHPAGKNGSLVAPMLSAVVLSALSGKIVVPLLRKLRASQTVRLDGPRSHLAKTGTPTAGGLFVIPCGVLVGVMYAGTSAEVLVTALGTAALGAVGLVDDFLKIKLQSSGGLGGEEPSVSRCTNHSRSCRTS